MIRQKIRDLLGYIGPYPYNPQLIFLFFFATYLSRLIPVVIVQVHVPSKLLAILIIILISFITSSIFASWAYLLQKYRPWSNKSLTMYIFEIMFAQSLFFLLLPFFRAILQRLFGFEYQILPLLTPGFFIGSLIVSLISLALLHQSERRITNKLKAADELIVHLDRDRKELIMSDETIREQVSRFLHDRVQSDLMVIGMELKSIENKSLSDSAEEMQSVIRRSISRLEKIRSSDLKGLTQILSPNFRSGGLLASVNSLLDQYRSSFDVYLHIDSGIESLDKQKLMGLFRIIEQATINSLIHGPASKVEILLTMDSDSRISLSIADDGPGVLVEEISPGLGTSIIDSWVGVLNGRKDCDSFPGHGYQLRITFPN